MAQFERASGILLHPTALPGPYGIGTFGRQALDFLDWLAEAGQKHWQICPLVPTGYGDSPYQGFSAFAGNGNLIDPDDLVNLGLLTDDELQPLRSLPADHVDFGRLIPAKRRLLETAWNRFNRLPEDVRSEFQSFRKDASSWLDDYALFMVLKDRHGGLPWNEWDPEFRHRDPETLAAALVEYSVELGYHAFVQFLFHRQWTRLKEAAADRGIGIIGDLPIFIAYDSSDCWAHSDLFQLDDDGVPTAVAGVPPDYFSATGQLWGNPLYDWTAMERNGFAWWISVLRHKLTMFDILRIDHFRGFAAYWAVPYGETTAVKGHWIPSPGRKLFKTVREALGDIPIIAEDLGVITDDVVDLMSECGFPGMKVLQFAFDSSEQNDYLPHTYDRHCLVYTGTHDNDTAVGWFESAPETDREAARAYLGLPDGADGHDAARAMIRAALASVADLAITPLQDVLGLGSGARFNTPGTLGGNWSWRAAADAFDSRIAEELRKYVRIYGRL